MNLSKPNILLKDEPNEIHVKIDEGISIFFLFHLIKLIPQYFFLAGLIKVFVNKYDSFQVNDTSSPIKVKYVSFASYDTAPMEFYYNCSSSKQNKNTHPQTNLTNHTIQTKHDGFTDSVQPIVKTVYSNSFSVMELVILSVVIISLSMNIVQLYSMYLFSKYLDN